MCTSSWCLSSTQCRNVSSGHLRHILWGVERVLGHLLVSVRIFDIYDVSQEISDFICNPFKFLHTLHHCCNFFDLTGQQVIDFGLQNEQILFFFTICISLLGTFGSLVSTCLFRVLNVILFNKTILPSVKQLTMIVG